MWGLCEEEGIQRKKGEGKRKKNHKEGKVEAFYILENFQRIFSTVFQFFEESLFLISSFSSSLF